MSDKTRKIMLAGNWKMNMTIAEVDQFFTNLNSAVEGGLIAASEKVDLTIAMPATLMAEASKIALKNGVKISSQNIHWEEKGAFTGEISAAMIKEVGVETTLVGHSERRQYFGETNETVAKKVTSSLKENLTVIACIGESQGEREGGVTEKIIGEQLSAILKAATLNTENLIIAYEPVWAIGTGLAATSAQAQEVHLFIRNEISKHWGEEKAQKTRILYGGSMKPENTLELIGQPDIDGGLIGGASLKADSYGKMIEAGVSAC